MDRITIEGLDSIEGIRVKIFEELESTNSYLKARAYTGLREGELIVAKTQSQGRGRRGRSFYSPKDTGIYMSLLLEPTETVMVELVTAALAVAAARAIKKTLELDVKIKWVNDIFYENRKVAGILTEGLYSGGNKPDYLIVGIGINLYRPNDGFLDGLDEAGYLLEEKKEGLLNLLIKDLIQEFWPLYQNLDRREFLKEYKKRSLLLGREILVLGEKPWKGLALDIDEDCNLLVEDQQGKVHSLYSGEVSVRTSLD
ncbi:MAG: biotin--[acetyl-CoA-carboxylase] ligase [Tissierellia bacterium]|nr:biotin--[acetyl-CoA-carboxylase] ligase [Tissierellia bacterium]